ncbi:MAG: transporter [Muribaculaceae bacterium]|nr:transporter [Muribaculaceae bacterium]
MKVAIFRQKIKPLMLPLAMIIGAVFHNYIGYVKFLAPWLIFTMLLITFCKVKVKEFRVTSLSYSLLFVQIVGSLAVYFALLPFNEDVAIATFICVFCPTATAAPVITGMLGGSVPRLATYSIVSNITVALLAPLLFSLMGSDASMGFAQATAAISMKVVPLIILPLVIALLLQLLTPKIHKVIAEKQSISFYLWSMSLIIVVGNAVSYMIQHHEHVMEMVVMALLSLLVCCLQFIAGRLIGRRCGDKIAGAQGLGQKNTVLAIWMALTFFHPVTSVGAAAYVAWQNIINSTQLYIKTKRDAVRQN